jgi:hypothetical protein
MASVTVTPLSPDPFGRLAFATQDDNYITEVYIADKPDLRVVTVRTYIKESAVWTISTSSAYCRPFRPQ